MRVRVCLAVAAATLVAQPALVSAQTAATTPATAGSQERTTLRDGQHDFDFLDGTWTLHLKRLLHPLTGSTTWVEYDGTAVARPVWGGRAQLDEFEGDDPATHSHIQGLTLRLYNPESHEWSLYYANAKNGALGLPPTVGHFNHDGRGEFYDHETFQGRPIVVRYTWSDITATSARFEQAFSADDGKTWETNWIYTCTRVKK